VTDDSVAAEYSIPPCRFCGLVHPYSGDDECDEQWAATLGLAIRRFVRRAEVERCLDIIFEETDAAVAAGPDGALPHVVCVGHFAGELARLALEER
jgi:hypothetical protein